MQQHTQQIIDQEARINTCEELLRDAVRLLEQVRTQLREVKHHTVLMAQTKETSHGTDDLRHL